MLNYLCNIKIAGKGRKIEAFGGWIEKTWRSVPGYCHRFCLHEGQRGGNERH